MRAATILMVALVAAACTEGDRDRAAREAADVDTALSAELDTAMGGPSGEMAGTTSGKEGTTPDEAMGGTDRAAGAALSLEGLTSAQVRQLQTALNDSDCNAGPVDGVVGAQTRQGIACAMKKNSVPKGDMGALYRSLDLDFGG